MAMKIIYEAHLAIGGIDVVASVEADTPEEALEQVKTLFKEMENKVESIRLADKASGYFLRGFS